MPYRNLSPEAGAAIAAMNGVLWVGVGVVKLRAARAVPRMEGLKQGTVSSVHSTKDGFIATIEYPTAAGGKKRLTWRCDARPSLGQLVPLRPKAGWPDELEIAQPGDSVGKAVLCLSVGGGLLLVATLMAL